MTFNYVQFKILHMFKVYWKLRKVDWVIKNIICVLLTNFIYISVIFIIPIWLYENNIFFNTIIIIIIIKEILSLYSVFQIYTKYVILFIDLLQTDQNHVKL